MEVLFWGLRQPFIWQCLIQSSMFWFLFLQHLPNTDPWMASLPFSLQWRYLNPTSYSLDYADAFTSRYNILVHPELSKTNLARKLLSLWWTVFSMLQYTVDKWRYAAWYQSQVLFYAVLSALRYIWIFLVTCYFNTTLKLQILIFHQQISFKTSRTNFKQENNTNMLISNSRCQTIGALATLMLYSKVCFKKESSSKPRAQ